MARGTQAVFARPVASCLLSALPVIAPSDRIASPGIDRAQRGNGGSVARRGTDRSRVDRPRRCQVAYWWLRELPRLSG